MGTARSIIAIVTIALCASPAGAAFETALEVWQPIETEEGIVLSRVTYIRYLTRTPPGYPVNFTCEASRVMTELGEFENRNASNLLGLMAWSDSLHLRQQLFGDTLRVFVDLSGITAQKTSHGWNLQTVVEATVECVLANAAQYRSGRDWDRKKWVEARYVELEIRGSTEYADLGGVFSFEQLGVLPRKIRWD